MYHQLRHVLGSLSLGVISISKVPNNRDPKRRWMIDVTRAASFGWPAYSKESMDTMYLIHIFEGCF